MSKLCKGADIIMKKIVSLIIAAALVICIASFVACGNKETDRVSDKISDALTTIQSPTTDNTTDETTTDSVTDDAVTDDDESMTGNVADNSNGVVESSKPESTKNETTKAK